MKPQTRTLLSALVLCMPALCAFAAASASAAGLTAVQCEKLGVAHKYAGSHCETPSTGGEYETVAFPANTKISGVEGTATTPLEGSTHHLGTTSEPAVIFHSTFSGFEITITCGTAHTSGGIFENIEVGGEMKIHLTESQGTYTECHASTKTKPNKICLIEGTAPATPKGQIKTNRTTGISGPEHKVTVKPEEGEAFTEFKILAEGNGSEACFTKTALPVKVTGEAWGKANTETHSHVTFNEATNAGSPLRANGNEASMTATGTAFTAEHPEIVLGAETF